MKTWAIVINTYREAIRNRILYTVLLFVVLLIAASTFFGSVTIGDQAQVIKDCGLFSLSFFGAIMTIITGVSLLNKELKQKTIYNILSKPVARWQFVLGKHLGLSLTVSLLVAVMGFGLFAYLVALEQQTDWLLFQGVAYAMMETTVIASVVIFFSSMAVTTTLPGIFTLGTYIAGHSIDYLKFFVGQNAHSSFFTRFLVDIASWILPDLTIFNANESIVYGHSLGAAQAGYAFLYCLAYSGAALSLAAIIFSKRELN